MKILFRRFAEVISRVSRGSLVIFRLAVVFLCREGRESVVGTRGGDFWASLKGYQTGISRV